MWKNEKYAIRQCKLQRRRPNNVELQIIDILNSIFPDEWKYVGDGKFWIDGKNPDFININGKKKIIEFNGDYWHRNDDAKKRISHFKKYGFETLILSDCDIKDINLCINKIKEFCGNKMSKVVYAIDAII